MTASKKKTIVSLERTIAMPRTKRVMRLEAPRATTQNETATATSPSNVFLEVSAVKHGGVLAVGDVVQIALDNVDLAKVDNKNLTCVVVELKTETGDKKRKKLDDPKYRVATKHGYLNTWMDRSYVNLVESLSASLRRLLA